MTRARNDIGHPIPGAKILLKAAWAIVRTLAPHYFPDCQSSFVLETNHDENQSNQANDSYGMVTTRQTLQILLAILCSGPGIDYSAKFSSRKKYLKS